MRVDGGSTYYFPAKLFECQVEVESRCYFPGPDGDDGPDEAAHAENLPEGIDPCRGITLELTPLSLLTQQGEQNPVGAQGWFASAVLSSLLLLDWRHPILKRDMEQLVSTTVKTSCENIDSPRTVLELGSGAISLVGMAMTWILAQYQQEHRKREPDWDAAKNALWTSRVLLTDNNSKCLAQLQINAEHVRTGIQEYFDASTYNINTFPDLQLRPLEWDNYDKLQPVLDVENAGTVDFVLGAELVYTSTGAEICSYQVTKILNQNPSAVFWLAQYPRDGWLQVLKIALERQLPRRLNLQSYDPTEIHPNVHALAQRLMPRAKGAQFDLKFIKVVRICLAKEDQ